MEDLKHLFKDNYLKYASYVILDRAIPDVVDGLKPVQRRILYTLFLMDNGKLHKVANVAGQTMALHPHGDAPINDALVNLANKGYLMDTQGNFGNPLTGDPNAAPRYIETRLSSLAKATLFNADLTDFIPSYDGRTKEPISLPAKIPLCLLQGAEGIAVGMSTKILPHNFSELIEAQIAILKETSFEIFPDFPSGGTMDPSEYDKGKGKIKLRAKIVIRDEKTLVIEEICYGTTTESLIRSIDEAAKKGKIKIDSIGDYTAEKVEIEIKLPRGQHAKSLINELYAFTDCEVTLHSNILVIKDKFPWEATTDEVLRYHTDLLKNYLRRELEIERDLLLEQIFEKNLEQIFIENRLYKKLETISTMEKIHSTITKSLEPYHHQLMRIPNEADRHRLLQIPIRRISQFDIEKNQHEIMALGKRLTEVEASLKNIKKFTLNYLQKLLKQYGDQFPRRTQITTLKTLDLKKIATRNVKVCYDPETGYFGTKVNTEFALECTNFDKVMVMYQDGSYQVMGVPEKHYIHAQDGKVVWMGIADKKTELSVIYTDPKTGHAYGKRFIVKQFILDKVYRYFDEAYKLAYLTSESGLTLQIDFKPKPKQKIKKMTYSLDEIPLKGVGARGIRIANQEIKKIKLINGH
ncbi:MAG: DNA topoisomerase IV subunit A [Chlamydiia bacterium]|nr:DNA topoisomerase IV subunit A [Chlamydiia bacterium]